MKKLFLPVVLFPLAIIVIMLSVANRHPVVFKLDPVNPEQPFFSISLPFFVFLFIMLFVGLAIGGTLTWFSQSKHRKMARTEKREAIKWQHIAKENEAYVKQIEDIKNPPQTLNNPESSQKKLSDSSKTG